MSSLVIQSDKLSLVLQSADEARAIVEGMSEDQKAQVSPD